MIKKKKNILLIAYACEPNKTSEPGVGWNFSKELSKYFNITVLTRENNKKTINEVRISDDERVFLYYDLPKIFQRLKKKLPLGTQLYYLFWQWGAYNFARNKNKKLFIDIVHHLTFGTSWISPPAFMLKRKFIWGPIGGGDFIPFQFIKKMKIKSILQESLYYALNKGSKFSPFSYLIRKKASAIIFRTKSSKISYLKTKTQILPVVSETASSDRIEKRQKYHNNFIYALCIGRMTYWKGFIYAVQGFHEFLKKGGFGKLELFGNGPELNSIKKYIDENNLQKHIFLKGVVDNIVIKEKLNDASILLHPSFRDGGSWAIMEAMSFGLPVICLNTSGPKDMVTDRCGFLIDLESSDQVSRDIGDRLFRLSKDIKLFNEFSQNARKRIKIQYSWEERGKQIKEIYKEVLNEV